MQVAKVFRFFTLDGSPSSLQSMYDTCQRYSDERPKSTDSPLRYTADNLSRPVGHIAINTIPMQPFKATSKKIFAPSQLAPLLTYASPRQADAGSFRFTLYTFISFHRPELQR
jgi:hypothetical protein